MCNWWSYNFANLISDFSIFRSFIVNRNRSYKVGSHRQTYIEIYYIEYWLDKKHIIFHEACSRSKKKSVVKILIRIPKVYRCWLDAHIGGHDSILMMCPTSMSPSSHVCNYLERLLQDIITFHAIFRPISEHCMNLMSTNNLPRFEIDSFRHHLKREGKCQWLKGAYLCLISWASAIIILSFIASYYEPHR